MLFVLLALVAASHGMQLAPQRAVAPFRPLRRQIAVAAASKRTDRQIRKPQTTPWDGVLSQIAQIPPFLHANMPFGSRFQSASFKVGDKTSEVHAYETDATALITVWPSSPEERQWSAQISEAPAVAFDSIPALRKLLDPNANEDFKAVVHSARALAAAVENKVSHKLPIIVASVGTEREAVVPAALVALFLALRELQRETHFPYGQRVQFAVYDVERGTVVRPVIDADLIHHRFERAVRYLLRTRVKTLPRLFSPAFKHAAREKREQGSIPRSYRRALSMLPRLEEARNRTLTAVAAQCGGEIYAKALSKGASVIIREEGLAYASKPCASSILAYCASSTGVLRVQFQVWDPSTRLSEFTNLFNIDESQSCRVEVDLSLSIEIADLQKVRTLDSLATRFDVVSLHLGRISERIWPAVAQTVADKMPKLNRLSLAEISQPGIENLFEALKDAEALETIVTSSIFPERQVWNPLVELINRNGNIKALETFAHPRTRVFDALADFRPLARLKVMFWGVQPSEFRPLIDYLGSNAARALESFEFNSGTAPPETVDIVLAKIKNLPALSGLSIPRGTVPTAEYLRNLRSKSSIERLGVVCDEGFVDVMDVVKNEMGLIRELSLSSCERLNDRLASHLPRHLDTVRVGGSSFVLTDNVFVPLEVVLPLNS